MLDRASGDGGGVLVIVDGSSRWRATSATCPRSSTLRRYGARLMVDEAHAVGVLGARGAGASSSSASRTRSTYGWGLLEEPRLLRRLHRGPAEVIEYLRFASRPFIFTASAVPAAVGAALGALRVIRAEGPALMAKLLDNAAYLRTGLRELGLLVIEPGRLADGSEATTPVVPVVVGEDWQAVLLWKALFDAGVYTNVAIHPAVPPGGALLRTSLMATHERAHLDRALEIIGDGRGVPRSPARLTERGRSALPPGGRFALSNSGQARRRAQKAARSERRGGAACVARLTRRRVFRRLRERRSHPGAGSGRETESALSRPDPRAALAATGSDRRQISRKPSNHL